MDPADRFHDFGPFRLDTAEHLLLRDGQPVPLTPKAYDTLVVLVRHGGRLVLKEQILETVWAGVVVAENNLNQTISALRRALGPGPGGAPYIETVPRRGYRFLAPVGVASAPAASPVAAPPRPIAPITSSRLRLWAALGAGAVLAIGVAAPLWQRPGPTEPPRLQRVTSSGHDWSPTVPRAGDVVAFASDRDGARRIWLLHLRGGGETALTAGPDDDRPRFSPDGASVLFSRGEGRRALYRAAVVGGEVRRLVEDASEGDWSPDGRRIVFLRAAGDGSGGSVVGVASADGGEAREIFRLAGGGLDSPRWSPDGRSIALRRAGTSTGVADELLLVTPEGASRSLRLPGSPGRLSSPAWASPAEIVYAQSESLVATRAAASTRVVRLDVDTGASQTVLWVPESVHALEVAGPGRLVFDAHSTRQSLRELGAAGPPAAPPRWLTQGQSNDRQPTYAGEWVVFSSDRTRNLDLWRVPAGGGDMERLTDHPADDWDPALSPDGSTLLWSSNRSGAFEVWAAAPDGSGARQLTRDGVDAENPTATADGWVVYSSAHPGRAGIWKIRLDGSQPTRLVAGDAVWPEASPDGSLAAYRDAPYDWPRARTPTVVVRVVRLADGVVVPFEVRVSEGLSAGRCRWMPGGRAIAFVDQDASGARGVFVQDFAPGRDTSSSRRALAALEPGAVVESFGLSRDGARLTVATREALSSVMLADPVAALRARP
jgi:eukaryotic-like serine/threonine-protein kinase